MQTSQEYFTTRVYAKFGGQTQCIMDNWKIVNTACKELKIAQIAQLNQIFQPLHLAHIYGHSFYEVSGMLLSKNVKNDVSKDSPITVA